MMAAPARPAYSPGITLNDLNSDIKHCAVALISAHFRHLDSDFHKLVIMTLIHNFPGIYYNIYALPRYAHIGPM